MDEARFWGLIDASRAQAADEGAGQDEVLADMLAELGAKEIVAFDATFRRLHSYQIVRRSEAEAGYSGASAAPPLRCGSLAPGA